MCLFREFVEGREVTNDKKDFRLLGYVMKEIHEKGFVMGDTKPSNFMISGETVFVIDAEQSTRNSSSEYKAWDILVLTLFSSFLFINEVVDFREAVREFLSSYELNREIALKLTGVKNAPLLALFLLHIYWSLRRSAQNIYDYFIVVSSSPNLLVKDSGTTCWAFVEIFYYFTCLS